MDQLHPVLSDRIRKTSSEASYTAGNYVLYLPTVVLRKQHNAGFAFACRLANARRLPLITLAVVLDDAYMPAQTTQLLAKELGHEPKIVFTARRIAFVLEALQSATCEWSDHGSGVIIRVHGTNSRYPHHLTLARNAAVVVTDEPFVQPYVNYVQAIERAAAGKVYRVDSSTTVPPAAVLRRSRNVDGVDYHGVPDRAYQWEAKTAPKRKSQVLGAAKEGLLDAPPLVIRLSDEFMFEKEGSRSSLNLPSDWLIKETSSPDIRPWTVAELSQVSPKDWILHWDGIDASVPPCEQTIGSKEAAHARWKNFLDERISGYAKRRNDITQPHAVSRMSCYLNYGVISIFAIIADLWATNKSTKKFEDEIIKWREIGYAHAIAKPIGFNGASSVPNWARMYLQRCSAEDLAPKVMVPLQRLETAASDDSKWNAMQNYLILTGELHNNARMTWGKTIVHWQKYEHDVELLLAQMVYLNDRFALDGLSPPSYAGLLWCLGWCDKRGTGVSEKAASRYRASPQAFEAARATLLSSPLVASQKRKRKDLNGQKSVSIKDYFSSDGLHQVPVVAASPIPMSRVNVKHRPAADESESRIPVNPNRRLRGEKLSQH